MLRYFCFLAVILGARCALAPFIHPCKTTDSACLVSSAQAAIPVVAPGLPELGIKTLDPMQVPLIKSDQSGLNLEFRDTVVTGLKGCVVEALKQDLRKGKQAVLMRCTVTLSGDYTIGGRLFVLPVQGDGKYTIHIRDILIKTATDIATVTGADGKPHWHISSWRHSYQVKTGADFQFQNLFNGNKVLAQPIEQFLNTNWRDVMQEVAPPIVRAIVSGVIDGVEALYKAVPTEELNI